MTIKSIVETSKELVFVDGFTTYNELKNYLVNQPLPHILLLDIQLKNNDDGIHVCKEISHKYPKLKIIMLSSITQSSIVYDAFKKGAMGFLPKNINIMELTEACNDVINNKKHIHKDISLIPTKKESQFEFIPKITKREKEVLMLIMKEMTSAEIAKQLYISQNTVENHRASLFSKTGVKNIVGLIKYTIEKGLLDES